MTHPVRLARIATTLVLLASSARAQPSATQLLSNPGFESGAVDQPPVGWDIGPGLKQNGGRALVTDTNPATGRYCLLLELPANKSGGVAQDFDATSLHGKRIRFRAAVRTETEGRGRAELVVELAQEPPASRLVLDDMSDRPIRASQWAYHEIVGDVPASATRATVVCRLRDGGRAWLDDVTFEVLGDAPPKLADEPPRPVTPQGLVNLVAFTRLLGYVRYFHPSDETAATDWESFAIAGVRAVENARDPEDLTQQLVDRFVPIASSVRIARTEHLKPAATVSDASAQVLVWQHLGIGTGRSETYSSKRVVIERSAASDQLQPYTIELGGGVACSVPLAIAVDAEKSSPPAAARSPAALPKPTKNATSPNDRSTRLAAVALAWNVIQHSFPYFDIVATDWPAELKIALQRAATDATSLAFLSTLRRLNAALHDGHGFAGHRDEGPFVPGFRAEWIEDQLVVTLVSSGSSRALGLTQGDVIASIDGRSVDELAASVEAEVTGATRQHIRSESATRVFMGARGAPVAIEFESFAAPGRRKKVSVPRDTTAREIPKRRGDSLREVEPGIFYLDLDRVTTDAFIAALPTLEKARGLVFDMRGYPGNLDAVRFFSHLALMPLTSVQWHKPHIARPDQTATTYVRFGQWRIEPKSPFLSAKRAFIIDGRSISYAESCMGIVEHYKLGAIVGGPTAGTNGNVNSMLLPGGYTWLWTGLKVLKHDGSQHHGIGILPTIPCAPTRAGIAAGRDELLERATRYLTAD